MDKLNSPQEEETMTIKKFIEYTLTQSAKHQYKQKPSCRVNNDVRVNFYMFALEIQYGC